VPGVGALPVPVAVPTAGPMFALPEGAVALPAAVAGLVVTAPLTA
jgi:hypothetical protein